MGLPTWAHALGAVLLLDFWMYIWHRINHVILFLWRFHRVHHHDPKMDMTTASCFHSGEIILSSLLRLGVIVLAGVHLWELVLYETVMFAVVQFHHANVALPDGLDGWDAPEDHRFAGLLWAPLKRIDSDEDLCSKAVSVEPPSRDGDSARTE
jgi:sterol desaturase/sphingolipid hydroxylase (fatty acid hydroxylase superfamily)